jgi:hypothetical protein
MGAACISFPSIASAEQLNDVRLWDIRPSTDDVELTLHAKRGPPGSYFFVDITKTDPDSFSKLVQAINKIMGRDKYRLDLNIRSFSLLPYGSRYRSEGVDFYSLGQALNRSRAPMR